MTTTDCEPKARLVGTVTTTAVAVFELIVAEVPPIVTEALPKFVPLMVSDPPRETLEALSELIVGAANTVNAELTVPPAVVTTTLPEPTVAPAGTVVVIEVAVLAVTVAAAPPMVTVAFDK